MRLDVRALRGQLIAKRGGKGKRALGRGSAAAWFQRAMTRLDAQGYTAARTGGSPTDRHPAVSHRFWQTPI